jgi:hypothetical protein
MPHMTEAILRALGRTIANVLPADREAGMRVMQYALEEYLDGNAGPIRVPEILATAEKEAAHANENNRIVILNHVRDVMSRRYDTSSTAMAAAAACALTALGSLRPILF